MALKILALRGAPILAILSYCTILMINHLGIQRFLTNNIKVNSVFHPSGAGKSSTGQIRLLLEKLLFRLLAKFRRSIGLLIK